MPAEPSRFHTVIRTARRPRARHGPAAAFLAIALLAAAPPFAVPLAAQGPDPAAAAVAAWVEANQHAVVTELLEFLRIPNVAADAPNIRRNAEALAAMLERRGVRARLIETDGPPMVDGELPPGGGGAAKAADAPVVLVYAHYDGQPADPARWVGHDPWQPVLRAGRLEDGAAVLPFPGAGPYDPDWRIYGRSASADKAPIVALLAALDALRASGFEPTVHLKFLFEGDEEVGSPNLEEVLRRNAELLRADLVVMADGPAHASGRPTLVFGVRGITTARLIVYGPARPLHSGHYGNWAPNPAERLARLLASMEGDDGRVRIAGWYDDVVPLTDEERAAIREVPAERPEAFGFAQPEGGPDALRLERIALPSLNVRGLAAAWVGGEARTIVPDSAVAELDLRVVPEVDPARQVERLVAHIRAQGYHLVETSPDSAARARHPFLARVVAREGGYPGMRTPLGHPLARRVTAAVRAFSPEEPVLVPMLGGSVPAAWFPPNTGAQVVLVPIVNPDNNQHAPNENLRLGNLFRGISTLAAVLRLPAAER